MLELTLRLIASLAVVVGLLLLLARFGARRFKGRAGELVRVVHRQPLTRTSAVSVVAVGTRVLVLGTTEQQVSILTELDPADLEDGLTGYDGDNGLDDVFDDEYGDEVLELPATVEPRAVAPAPPAPVTPVFTPMTAQSVPVNAPLVPTVSSGLTSQSLLEAITQSTQSAQSPLGPRRPGAHRARLTHLDEAPEVPHVDAASAHPLTQAAPVTHPEPVLEPVVVAHPVVGVPTASPSPQPVEPLVTAPTMKAVLAALAALEEGPRRVPAAAEQLLDEEAGAAPVDREIDSVHAATTASTAASTAAVATAARASRAATRRAARTGYVGEGPLAGSVLSVSTWRQAFAAATGKAS